MLAWRWWRIDRMFHGQPLTRKTILVLNSDYCWLCLLNGEWRCNNGSESIHHRIIIAVAALSFRWDDPSSPFTDRAPLRERPFVGRSTGASKLSETTWEYDTQKHAFPKQTDVSTGQMGLPLSGDPTRSARFCFGKWLVHLKKDGDGLRPWDGRGYLCDVETHAMPMPKSGSHQESCARQVGDTSGFPLNTSRLGNLRREPWKISSCSSSSSQ